MGPEVYGKDRVFVGLRMGSEGPDLSGLAEAGHPVIHIDWKDTYDLGGQYFLWEFAIAVAGYGLGIHPFNQPNVEAAKVQARKLVDTYIQSGALPEAESEALSAMGLAEFLSQGKAGDYIALQAYVQPTEGVRAALGGLRKRLLAKYGLATTLGFGPRFLHSTGQLHKGDGGNGLFVQMLSAPPQEDVAIPLEAGKVESEIGFGVLKRAQALGDAGALREVGRRVVTFEVEGEVEEAVRKVAGSI
jgi:hypothetical protein